VKQAWTRRRWYEFRQGHSFYLILLLSVSNFVLIFHRLLIERVSFLDEVFSQLWFFFLIFVLGYVPVAILIGHWHNKTQFKVDTEIAMRQNPLFAKGIGILLDMQGGKASQEDVDNFRELLRSIEAGHGGL